MRPMSGVIGFDGGGYGKDLKWCEASVKQMRLNALTDGPDLRLTRKLPQSLDCMISDDIIESAH
jgi:hypothetical protein